MHRFSHLFSFAALSVLIAAPLADALAQGGERFRTFWRGQWVDYVEVGDYAITEGDIIIGHKDEVRAWREAVERGQAQMAETLKGLAIDSATRLWSVRGAGVVLIPYTIDAGNATHINGAVNEMNRLMAGVVRWIPRTAEADYVAFNLTSANSGACASFVGRRGGKQDITGDPECGVGTLVHEMGHAMGLWHVQQDARAAAFVDLRLSAMDAAKRSNNQPIFATRTFGGYDYASNMHYSRTSFPASSGERITLETKPPGIDVGSSTLSPADIDTLLRLYGGAPTRTTIHTNPSGLRVIVNGTPVTTPATFDWPIGSVHRLWVEPVLQMQGGFRFAFGRWSHDPSAVPSSQLTWEVKPGDGTLGSPETAPADTVIVANFVRLIDVQATPHTQPGGASSVIARSPPWEGTTNLFPQFTRFDLTASPAAGFEHFFTWGSAVNIGGAGVRRDISLLLPGSLSTQTIGANFHNGPSIVVNVEGPGTEDGVSVRITAPGSTATTSVAPRLARTTPGNWRFEMSSPQTVGSAIRNFFESYEGFDDPTTGTVAMPSSGVRNVTIRARREVAPFRQVVPSCAGSITVSDSATWLRTGTPLTVNLATTGAGLFTGWSGTLSGSALSQSIAVGADVPEFTARFNSVAVPLKVSTIEPSVIGDDGTSVEAVVRGTGFTSASRVFVAGVQFPATFVGGNTLRVTLTRAFMGAAGRVPVFVQNALTSFCSVNSNSVAFDVLPPGRNAAVRLTEFYNEAFDYYFLTGRDADKRLLDGLAGWRRTGQEIRLQAVGNEQTVPLERHFFADVARGGARGSHFFTSLADEQRLLTGLNPTNAPARAKPVLEGIEGHAFPRQADGACASPSIPVYRAFKAPPRYPDDGNHRFSTSFAIHRDMVDRLGWADEGIRFCALP